MRLRYTVSARADTDEILAHIAHDNPSAAAAVGVAMKAAMARLCYFPRIGAETDDAGVYMKIVRPYPYLIFYSIDGEWLVIRNVRHPAQRRPPSEQ